MENKGDSDRVLAKNPKKVIFDRKKKIEVRCLLSVFHNLFLSFFLSFDHLSFVRSSRLSFRTKKTTTLPQRRRTSNYLSFAHMGRTSRSLSSQSLSLSLFFLSLTPSQKDPTGGIELSLQTEVELKEKNLRLDKRSRDLIVEEVGYTEINLVEYTNYTETDKIEVPPPSFEWRLGN